MMIDCQIVETNTVRNFLCMQLLINVHRNINLFDKNIMTDDRVSRQYA